MAALSALALAQGAYDSGTPAESKAGASTASTYAADKIETVNLANGNLSMNVPLASVGGRGSAGFTLALSYNSKLWSSEHERVETGQDPFGSPTNYYHHYYARFDEGSMSSPNRLTLGSGWSISLGPALKMRRVNIGGHPCSGTINSRNTCYDWVLTKLSLVLPDGGEVELRDQYTQGAPHYVGGVYGAGDRWRGRVWQAGDGSAATFVSDADNGVVNDQLAGWVFLADGTRLRMEADQYGQSAHCIKIADRNGNFVTIDQNPTTYTTTYTDELGRQVVLGSASPSVITVTTKGYAGVADRTVSINVAQIGAADAYGVLSNLRADFRSLPRPFTSGDYQRNSDSEIEHTIQGAHTDLFSGSEGAENIDDQYAVTTLTLPDGHTLRFRYNQYGEVSEVIYPGGGASQLDYQGFVTSMCEGISPFQNVLDRRVVQRRVLADGANTDAVWLYSRGTGSVNGVSYPTATVEARQGTATGTLLLSEKHFFLALKAEYRTCHAVRTGDVSSDGTGYERWDNAKEFRVETQTGSGTRVTVREWQQRAPVAYLSEPYAVYTQEQPANDPRVVREDSYLEDGRMRRVETGYDQFNNVTSVKEYDFGNTSGNVGALSRQTFRTYATNVNGYCYTNLNGTDGSCGGALASDVGTIIHQRRLLLSQTVKDGSGNQEAYSEVEYDNYSGDGNHASLTSNSGMVGYDGARFSNFSSSSQPRGNATRTAAWAGGSSYLYAYARYDDAGNVVSTKDARQIESFVSHADQFADGVGRGTYAFVTSTTSAVPDPTNERGTNTPLTSSTTYEYATGQARTATDANGKTTSFQYDDPLNRLTRVDRPDAGWMTYYYGTSTSAGQPSDYVRTQAAIDGSRSTDSYQFFDMLGRPSRAFLKVDNSSTPFVTTDTQYDALGRVWRASNPYLTADSTSAINPSGRWTTNAYDLAGRVMTVTTPDGAFVTSAYSGSQVTVTDQAGKQRRSVSDALGRLTSVTEAPGVTNYGFVTTYAYDARGNLRKVDQGGQLRFFMYDSLSRLIRAKNPEQTGSIAADADFPALTDSTSGNGTWSMGYTYDADGNLYKSKDARNTVTTYTYDNLNRAIRTDYSDGTPYTLNTYDFAQNGRGHYYADYESSTAGTLNYVPSYDEAGRPKTRTTGFYQSGTGWVWGFDSSLTYDFAGNVLSQTYPSGHTVNYSYDAAGRLADDGANPAFRGNLGDGTTRTYSAGVSYDEASRMKEERFGTQVPLYHRLAYNSRGQMTGVNLGTSVTAGVPTEWNRGALSFDYGTTTNNGNLVSQTLKTPNDDQVTGYAQTTQTYAYDSLNRLSSVGESNGSGATPVAQGYTYDRFGNRTIGSASGGAQGTQFDGRDFAATNRLYAPGDVDKTEGQRSMRYDAAGNLVYDEYKGAGGRTYDAENRMTMAWSGSTLTGTYQTWYTYDASGKRTRRNLNGQVTWQVYGFGGELLAEYAGGAAPAQPQKEYGYRGGELLVTASAPSAGPSNAVNVAAASNGATASASSYDPDGAFGPGTHTRPSDAIDGVRAMSEVAYGTGYWRAHPLPSQWLEVDFSGSKTISGIDVYTPRDNYPDQSDPTSTETFTLYGATSYNLQYWDGAAWQGVPGASVTGNNLVRRSFAFAPVTTAKIRLNVTAGAGGVARITELEAWGAQAAPPRTNVASTANGATASAQSYTADGVYAGSHFQPLYANDGVRYIHPPDGDRYWRDEHGLPSWLEIDFAGSKTIDEVDVYTVADYPAYQTQADPSAAQTFTQYGVTAFEVQYWTGSAWANVPGGGVSGNNLVWRKLTFGAVTTSKIRVVVSATTDGVARIAEVEAWAGSGGSQQQGAGAEVNWLVSDHLGTPRMVVDQTGSLSGVKRHDYLPFGEELVAGAGGRTAGQGYSADNVRQKFTGYERDTETGLDFAQARYYASTQGRFTGVDPFDPILVRQGAADKESAEQEFRAYLGQPQQWNRYTYAVNNPLLYVDPTGEAIQLSNDEKERERQMQALREAVGPGAAGYLYVNQGTNADGSPNYYVGIYDYNPNGDRRSFEQVNDVAGEFGAIIRDQKVVTLEFVGRGVVTDDFGDSSYIGPASSTGAATPAATGIFKGRLVIKMLDWSKHDLGYLPGAVMSNNQDNMMTPSVMQGHELGHARAVMMGATRRVQPAVDLENKIRRLQFPNGPTRTRH